MEAVRTMKYESLEAAAVRAETRAAFVEHNGAMGLEGEMLYPERP